MSQKVFDWITGRFQQPLSLLLFLFGVLVILLGLSTGVELPVLKQLVPADNFRLVSIAIGIAFVGLAIFFYYRPVKNAEIYSRPAQDIELDLTTFPDDVTFSFDRRLNNLSERQKRLLDFIKANGLVTESTVETTFHYSEPEIFYRIEQLRLLGFVNKEAINERGHRMDAYRLSQAYQDNLARQRTAIIARSSQRA